MDFSLEGYQSMGPWFVELCTSHEPLKTHSLIICLESDNQQWNPGIASRWQCPVLTYCYPTD